MLSFLFCIIIYITGIFGQKVYVYEDPAVDWSYLLDCYEEQNDVSILLDERVEHAQNTGEIWMHKNALLYKNRVLDPADAEYFYVPMYIALSSNMDVRSGSLMCNGLTHSQRLEKALDFITKSEYYITRGGSDHILTCTWFWCGQAIGNHARVVFQRSFIGINENNNQWARWECTNKIVTVPYAPNSIITNPENIRKSNDTTVRTIPFYFSGSSRDRADRLNLRIVNDIVPGSKVHISDNWWKWSETPEEFAENIMNSKFCFIPRGDTLSSRRLFDAIVSGCVPVLTRMQIDDGMVPFANEIDYNDFCILVHEQTFLHKNRLSKLVSDLIELPEPDYLKIRGNINLAIRHLNYGTIDSPNVQVFNTFMKVISDVGFWQCEPTAYYKTHAERVSTKLFPPNPNDESVQEWVLGKEMIVNREHGILMCSPPFTNSENFIKKFMLGLNKVSTWNGEHVWENDGVDFLKVEDYSFHDIFMGVDWIKNIFYRDPVVRILDIFTSTISMDVKEFRSFVKELHETKNLKLEGDFRTISSQCGFRYSHYPTFLRSDDEYVNSRFMEKLPEPMKSVGNGMEFYELDRVKENLISCEWDYFYDVETLERVYEIYDEDYVSFNISKNWVENLGKCGKHAMEHLV